jgi:hypothetical protein
VNHEGVLSFEAIPDEDVKAREEELAELYKVALDGWKEGKKEAEKENKPFTDKEPPKPEFSVIKGGLTKESAEKYCEEYKSAYEKNHPVEEKSKDEKDKAEKASEKKDSETAGKEEKTNPEPKPEQPKAE